MIYLGADHRGFKLKKYLKQVLDMKKFQYQDLGNTVYDPLDDHVDFAEKVAKKVAENVDSKGVVICGSGVGVSIVANKVKGIRCGQIFTPDMAEHAREHDDVNVISLAGDELSEETAGDILLIFLNTGFSEETRFIRRINKIHELEKT